MNIFSVAETIGNNYLPSCSVIVVIHQIKIYKLVERNMISNIVCIIMNFMTITKNLQKSSEMDFCRFLVIVNFIK